MKRKLVIIGTGLFAEVAKDYFHEYTDYEVVGFACHSKYKDKEIIADLPVQAIEDMKDFWPETDFDAFVAIGYQKMNKVRESVYKEIKDMGYFSPSFVHPNVKIWDTSQIGKNVFIFEDNTIQPYSSIGNNTILWSGNHIGHHSSIGDNCFISSHVVISGSCVIRDNVFIGVNSTLRDGLTIEKETLIGAGALIMKDTKEKEVYVSAPDKPFTKNSEEVGF